MEQTETPLSELISSSEQEGSNSKEVAVVKKKSKVFPIVVSILLLLILGVGGYYVYNQYFVDREENNEEENIAVTENDSDEYSMKNTGWALFSLPEYEFSAEISPYTMNEIVENIDVEWIWTVNMISNEDNANSNYKESLYPNYLKGVLIEFHPIQSLNSFNCDEGCAKNHTITVSIYENIGNKTLAEVKDVYLENVKEAVQDENFIPTITETEGKKWGHDVINYSEDSPAAPGKDLLDRNILVTTKFVYVIETFQSTLPTESYQESQKVIESFEFGG